MGVCPSRHQDDALLPEEQLLRKRRASLELQRLEEEAQQKRCRVSVDLVKLNIGGHFFETSQATLRQCIFFDRILGGEFGPCNYDSNGRLFVDRSGALFVHILEYLRSRCRPAQAILDKCQNDLIAECEYFGIDILKDELEGRTSAAELRPSDRALLFEERDCAAFFASQSAGSLDDRDFREKMRSWDRQLLLPVFPNASSFELQPAEHLEVPLLFHRSSNHPVGCALRTTNFEDFRNAFDNFTGGLLRYLEDSKGIVFAGGSVVGALTGTEASDIDIFLCGLTAQEAEAKLWQILRAVKQRDHNAGLANESLVVTRSRLAVTINPCPRRADEPELPAVQVILALHCTPLEVIVNFDIDCCGFAYDLSASAVYCTPRAHRAVCHRCNIVESNLRSVTYDDRLEKYANRGYSIGVPGLKEQYIDSRLYNGKFLYEECFGVLIRLEGERKELPEETSKQFHVWFGYTPQVFDLPVKYERGGRCLKGLERLLVLDEVHYKHNRHIDFCSSNVCFRVPDEAEDFEHACLCLASERDGQYVLLSGMEFSRSESGGMCKLQNMYAKRWAQQMYGRSEFDMEKLSSEITLRNSVACRQMNMKHIGVVFDSTLISNDSHDDLQFIRDAYRGPLRRLREDVSEDSGGEVDDERFCQRFGLPRRLEFRRGFATFQRQCTPMGRSRRGDLWHGIYR